MSCFTKSADISVGAETPFLSLYYPTNTFQANKSKDVEKLIPLSSHCEKDSLRRKAVEDVK